MEIACPKCRHVNPPAAKFCLQCGAQLNEISQNRSSDPLVGRQVGNLRLVKRIGSGGMGVVYLAEHVNLGKPYAIKFLHPQFAADQEVVERFRREARVIASLDHENIIRETDFGWFDSFGFYLVMEYLEGKTLKQVIRGGEALPPARILNLFEQLCGALEEAHEKDIVHRDLKPENLFLLQRRGREVLKILDFGIARIAQTGIPSEFTVDGEVYGSPTYMSPEQARGDLSQITPRSDLYSVGVILFEAISGRTPFQGKTPTEVMLGHITHTPPRLSDIRPDLPPNPALEALLAKALAKDPSQRFASAWQIYEALRSAFRPQKDELESTYDDRPEEDTTTLDMDGDVSAVLSDPQRFLHERSNLRERDSLASSPFIERSILRGKQPPQEPCEKNDAPESRNETANTGSFVGSKSISTTASELAEDSQAAGKSAQSWPPQSAPSSASYPNVQGSLPPLNANLSHPSGPSQHPERSISGMPSPFLPRSSETSLASVPSPLPQALAPSSPNALPFPGFASPPPLSQSPLSRLPAPPTIPMPAPSFLEMLPPPPSSSHSPVPLSLPSTTTPPKLSPPAEKDISTTDAATSVVLLPDRNLPRSPQTSAQEDYEEDAPTPRRNPKPLVLEDEPTPRKNPKTPQIVRSLFDESIQHDDATRSVDLASILPPGSQALQQRSPSSSSQIPDFTHQQIPTATEMIAPIHLANVRPAAMDTLSTSLAGVPSPHKPPPVAVEEEPTSLDQAFARDIAKKLRTEKQSRALHQTVQDHLPPERPLAQTQASPKGPLLMLVGVVSVLLIALGIWFFFFQNKTAPTDPAPPPEGQLPPVPQITKRTEDADLPTMRVVLPGPRGSRPVYTYSIHLLTFPAGAEVWIKGHGKVARTPCILDIAANATLDLRLQKQGYQPRDFTWRIVAPRKMGIKLEKLEKK